MKILHVITSVNPRGGGPIEAVRQLALAQQAAGHETEIASLDDPATVAGDVAGLPVHALGPGRTHYWYNPRLMQWLNGHCAAYDVVVVNGLWQYGSYATWRAAQRRDVPYVAFPHGMLDPWFKHKYPLKHAKKWVMWPWTDYRVLRDARAVIFTCEEERLRARESFRLYRANETIVTLGIAEPPDAAQRQRELFHARFPGLKERRLLLFLGRLQEKKGCDLLIRAFADAARKHPDLHLVMAGPDQAGWQPALLAMAHSAGVGERITWTGMLEGELKWGAYRAASAFVLPSHQENFGIAVAEALACGVPVLISNKVNIWREIAHAQAGLVADDTNDGTHLLLQRWLAMNPVQRAGMGLNARRCYERHFEAQRAAAHFSTVLDSCRRPRSGSGDPAYVRRAPSA